MLLQQLCHANDNFDTATQCLRDNSPSALEFTQDLYCKLPNVYKVLNLLFSLIKND